MPIANCIQNTKVNRLKPKVGEKKALYFWPNRGNYNSETLE